jgi:hypothetical protein
LNAGKSKSDIDKSLISSDASSLVGDESESKSQSDDGSESNSYNVRESLVTFPVVFIFKQPLLEKHFKKHITV